jgi:glycosyltransferase involved in cell wall biosynthesis
LKPNLAIEHADYATILGNEFTINTYKYATKPMYRVPISTPALYPWPEDKDFERSRNHFLWLSSAGFVHKGLDLVLEAFIEMTDHDLTICGPLEEEKAFQDAYYDMLYRAPNIHAEGWVDISGSRFLELTKNSIAVVYPSCSEGGGGSVVSCMHAGLIPIVSREASVDVHESFGLVLKECSIGEIKASVKEISRRSAQELKQMARAAWEFARANHTKEKFAETYRKAIFEIMTAARGPSVPETVTARPFYQASSSISDTDIR